MYTTEQLELIKKDNEGVYFCCNDCAYICSCKKNKLEPNTPKGKQLQEIGVLKECPEYWEEDK